MALSTPTTLLYGTLVKSNADGKDRFAYIKRLFKEKREAYCREMAGLIAGPLPVPDYISKFTPISNATALPPLPKVVFDKVPLEAKDPLEFEMYPGLIEQFKLLTPGFEWFESADDTGSDNLRLRPDISFIEAGRWRDAPALPPLPPRPQTQRKGLMAKAAELMAKLAGHTEPAPQPERRPYDWKRCEFGVEVKRSKKFDAFTDLDDRTVENGTKDARSSRGQLISYVKEQMSRQHRTSMHQVFIFGDHARLLFFDRSGGVVTEKFNYHTHPEILAEFFWRYSHMDQAARGWDPSVIPATKEETRMFTERVGKFVKECGCATGSNPGELTSELFAETLKADYPTFRIELESPGHPITLLIRRPFFEPFSPVGRATRGYVAYDVNRDEIVFLKDTWRTEHRDRKSEPEIYEFLASRGITHLPKILYAADVQGPDGTIQKTLLNEYAVEVASKIRPFQDGGLRGHVHCRIVQQLAFPLSSFRDSKELVRILRDALLAIKCAYEAGVLHRDISLGNVMIAKDGKGILNDWDHSREVSITSASSHSRTAENSSSAIGIPFRTGTWQFMSIHILETPNRRHTVLDDIESVYWLLLYCALHWLPHDDPGFDMQLFDEQIKHNRPNLPPLVVGGDKKSNFLTKSRYRRLQFDSRPLHELLQELGHLFKSIYWGESAEEEAIRSAAHATSTRLQDVTDVLALFNNALDRQDWPEHDRVDDQFRSKTENEEARMEHDNTVSSYGSGSTSYSVGPSTTSFSGPEPSNPSTDRSLSRAKGKSRSLTNRPKRSKKGSMGPETPADFMSEGDLRRKAMLSRSASTSSSTDSSMMPGSFLPMPSTPPLRPARLTRSSSKNVSTSSPKRGWEEASGEPGSSSHTPTKKQKKY